MAIDAEMISIDIPKSLYDRVNRFGYVDSVIVSELTDWVEIMEDEERLTIEEENKRTFTVYLKPNAALPHCEVIHNYEEDRDSDFVGTFTGNITKESLLTIAKEGYGISESEIEFVET